MDNTAKCGIALGLFLCACPVIDPPLKPPAPPTDGSPCARACERLDQLRCPEAEPEPGIDGKPGTGDDVPCLEWMCAADYLDYEAIARAMTCDEVR